MKKIISILNNPLEWKTDRVYFRQFNEESLGLRLSKIKTIVTFHDKLLLIQINNFFSPAEDHEVRDYFKKIPLDTTIITRTNELGLPIARDNPSRSFSYEEGERLLKLSANFIGIINQFIAWLANQTNSDIQLYTSYESKLRDKKYIDSGFICNKIHAMSFEQAAASLHTDYPYIPGSGEKNCFFNFTLTIFITSELFNDPGFGTQFQPTPTEPAIVLPCKHLQIAIFNGDIKHGFCTCKELKMDENNWRASVTWKCRAIPKTGDTSLKEEFANLFQTEKRKKTKYI